ncbi:MAG: hypothetical protein ABIL11_10145 [Chloroflexota bacterium]
MMTTAMMVNQLETVFKPRQVTVLAEVITAAYNTLVKASDLAELKVIVRDLAQAQQRTEQQIAALTQAQQRTEQQVAALTQAQQRTEQQVTALTQAQQRTELQMQRLAQVVEGTNRELGGLSCSMSYALENEAYRVLPALLRAQHGIEMEERIVRAEIGGKEINVFGRGTRAGQPVLIVGEVKLRLDERRGALAAEAAALAELDEKVGVVRQAYPEATIVPLLVTHYARVAFLQSAQQRGIIVVQSFEW